MARRLITIPISHYCEKARWSLDRAGVAYEEDAHLQGFHVAASKLAGGSGTTPVLVTEDAGVLGESADVLAYASRHGPPELGLYGDGLTRNINIHNWTSRDTPLVQYVATLPKESLVAASFDSSSSIQTFARRTSAR